MPLSVGMLSTTCTSSTGRARPAPASSCRPARCSASMRCAPPPRARSASVQDRHPQAAHGPRRRAPAGGARHLGRWPEGAAARVRGHARGRPSPGFPANVNVAVALSLAGIGPDRTRIEIWADPGVTRNTHTIIVKSDSSDLTMTIENIPSEENPRTGKITALERARRAAPPDRPAGGRELSALLARRRPSPPSPPRSASRRTPARAGASRVLAERMMK